MVLIYILNINQDGKMNKFGIVIYNNETKINGVHWSRNSISKDDAGGRGINYKYYRRIINNNRFGIVLTFLIRCETN